jgi:hypothetical protein
MALPQPKPAAAFRKHVLALLGETYGDKTLVLCPTAFVTLLNGDHKAAILLAQMLYWSDRTKDPEGWFYKSYTDWQLETGLSESQVRRIVNGDPRVQTPQITLRDLGVETVLKKVKRTGAPTLHYRINQTQFLASVERLQGQSDSQHCEESTTDKAQDEPAALPGMNTDQCQPSLITPEITNLEISAEDHSHQNPAHHPDEEDDDLDIFLSYESRFGKLKDRFHDSLRNELTRLGATNVREVLERCATRGRSWAYVQRALANEAVVPESQEPGAETRYGGFLTFNDDQGVALQPTPTDARLAVSERLQIGWPGAADPHATVLDAWNAALHQLEAQLDQASFNTCLRGAILIDFEPESPTFVVVVRTSYARDLLKGRLDRMVNRVLTDVYGQPVALKYLLKEDWGEIQDTAAIA